MIDHNIKNIKLGARINPADLIEDLVTPGISYSAPANHLNGLKIEILCRRIIFAFI